MKDKNKKLFSDGYLQVLKVQLITIVSVFSSSLSLNLKLKREKTLQQSQKRSKTSCASVYVCNTTQTQL